MRTHRRSTTFFLAIFVVALPELAWGRKQAVQSCAVYFETLRSLGKGESNPGVQKYLEKVQEYRNLHEGTHTTSREYHQGLRDLLHEGAALSKDFPHVVHSIAAAYTKAKAEEPAFWKKAGAPLSGKDWDRAVTSHEEALKNENKKRSEQFRAMSLAARYPDSYAALEDPVTSVYLSGAQSFDMDGLSQHLPKMRDSLISHYLKTEDEGYLRDAANIIALQQRLGQRPEIDPGMGDMVLHARNNPYQDTPMMRLDAEMKAMVRDPSGEATVRFFKDLGESIRENGTIPDKYRPLLGGPVHVEDGTHKWVFVLRHPSSGFFGFLEVQHVDNGAYALTGRSEAMYAQENTNRYFKDGTEELRKRGEKDVSCNKCHNGPTPRKNHGTDSAIGHDAGELDWFAPLHFVDRMRGN